VGSFISDKCFVIATRIGELACVQPQAGHTCAFMSAADIKRRIYLVMSKKARLAYIGKGDDPRIDAPHSKEFLSVKKQSDVTEWASKPFSSDEDARIAEAAAIRIAIELRGTKAKLVNKQKNYESRFGARYPFKIIAKQVKKSHLPHAIIVTLKPGTVDERVAPNSPAWKPKELAKRARMWWKFGRTRVKSWSNPKRKNAPDFLVAVAKGSGRILAVFKIDNGGWHSDIENKKPKNNPKFVAVPVKDNNANANHMQGKQYIGDRRGGSVTYGNKVA
jgi:hypothetical protein